MISFQLRNIEIDNLAQTLKQKVEAEGLKGQAVRKKAEAIVDDKLLNVKQELIESILRIAKLRS